jgi:hypothetical protein
MDEKNLDRILRAMSRERYTPSDELVRRTKTAIRGRRLFQWVLFLSIVSQLVVLGIVVFFLTSPEADTTAKIFGWISLFAYVGSITVSAVAARERVKWFFKKAEQLIV